MRHFLLILIMMSLISLPAVPLQAEEIHLSSVQVQVEEIPQSSVPVQAEEIPQSGLQADLVVIEKTARRLTLFNAYKPIKTYKIALGRSPIGAKYKTGDRRTPEGFYTIDKRNPDSKYHRSLHITYPNERDLEIAGMLKVPPGSGIEIHGAGEDYDWMGKFHAVLNWTNGCIAVTNEEIEEIWDIVPDGTEVMIRP